MYPAPPVTRTLSFISALQAEEALQRLEQAVPPPGLRGLFEGDGRLVQELVEQRMAEVLDFSAVTGVDSSAVALLLEWRRQAGDRGKRLEYVNLPANLLALAQLYGVAELIQASG